jgi:hypothetical protein
VFRYPTIRARGFAGSTAWRRRGEWWPTGRRRIPVAEISRLWLLGLTAGQICEALGEFKGTKFTRTSVAVRIAMERKKGNYALFPIRRSADDGEPDHGINERTQRALGI